MDPRLQFLNLSIPSASVAPRVGSSNIPHCFSFVIARDPTDKEQKARSQNRDLRICGKLVEALRIEELRASRAARWKPWGAGTHIEVPGAELVLWLNGWSEGTVVRCYVSTRTRPRKPSYYLSADWAQVRASIDRALTQSLTANSVAWKTEAQLEEELVELIAKG